MKIRDFLIHLQAILLLPFVAIVVVPVGILVNAGVSQFTWQAASTLDLLISLVAALLILIGLVLLINTISLFIAFGEGSLAPWAPTKRLVVQGIYRNLRHPMISGVFLLLLGLAGVLRVAGLLAWAILFIIVNVIYIRFVEEAGLEKRFGKDYLAYEKNVPGWIPRLKPWTPGK
jgi:protein-S-isoprenylcysteine O-methyltransferase Ste14